MRKWTIIPNGSVFEGDDGGPEPYTAAYEVERYCEAHSEATEADVERIAAAYHCHVRWND